MRSVSNRYRMCGIALLSFAAGSLMTQVRADSNRVFELRVYHAVPGKMRALEARFHDTVSSLLAKHHLNVVGYWVGEDPSAADNFYWLVAHSSREDAKKNYDAMRSDPVFQEMVKSEQQDKLVEKIDSTFLRPTDFSPMK